jgi:aminoglycoside phosphotransferase (APT) family kinase protein
VRHGLAAHSITRLPDTGIFNAIYLLGDSYVLRVPRVHPVHFAALRKESVAIPAARAAGVRTPRLLAYDETCDLLPVPYSILERVHGDTLGLLDLEVTETPDVWRALGHELALLHAGVPKGGPVAALDLQPSPDPRAIAERLASDGHLTAVDARWLVSWLDSLAPFAEASVSERFGHGDVQATNIMVSEKRDYLALLDWGSSGWGDPAWDFVGMPMRAVPFMLEGYRAVHPLTEDDTAEARITWRQLQVALMLARRGPQPERSWGERPLAMLLDIMRFFAEDSGPRWRAAHWTAPIP